MKLGELEFHTSDFVSILAQIYSDDDPVISYTENGSVLMSEYRASEFKDLCNRLLAERLEKAEKMYLGPCDEPENQWYPDRQITYRPWLTSATHTARLVCIEAIE